MIWTRGTIITDDALRISVQDRALEHGLGLFETLRTWNGRPALLPRHLERLKRSAENLRIPLVPGDLPKVEDIRALLLADGRDGDATLRITLSGGTSETAGSTVWMTSRPLPPPPPAAGCRLGPTAPAQPGKLAGCKSLNYWPYRLAHEEARAGGFDECLLVDSTGAILEGSRTSVFFVIDGRLVTPAADGRIVPGIMRGFVLELARSLGIAVEEASLKEIEARERVEEFFLTNAIRGILPVGRWWEKVLPAPGALTASLQRALTRRIGRAAEPIDFTSLHQ